MHGWNGDGHMSWMGIWWLVGAAIIAVVVWALVRSSLLNGSSKSPEQVIKRRYAKGEIDQATYQRMLAEIKG